FWTYPLSLHDALPIWSSPILLSLRIELPPSGTRPRRGSRPAIPVDPMERGARRVPTAGCVKQPFHSPGTVTCLHGCAGFSVTTRSEEHTSELQSRENL